MLQNLQEPIQVAGVFTQGKFTPRAFQWRSQAYHIAQVTASHNWKDGQVRKRHYAVTVKEPRAAQLYVLEFWRDQESWYLHQVWVV